MKIIAHQLRQRLRKSSSTMLLDAELHTRTDDKISQSIITKIQRVPSSNIHQVYNRSIFYARIEAQRY